jgi:hypothetical protein
MSQANTAAANAANGNAGTTLEDTIRLSIEEPLAIDVTFCDLVRAPMTAQHGEPLELRFRGQRHPDGRHVRLHVPLSEIEGALISAGALAKLIDQSKMPSNVARPMLEVPLLKYALRITKLRAGNGSIRYDVQVRRPAPVLDLEGYLQTLRWAADTAAPELQKRGFAVGAADVISIAAAVYADPRHQSGGRE